MTVVFADMTESVRRTSGLTAEEATELVNPLLESMVELMIRYGGRIDRFLGDGVLAVFGVPTIHEDDPIRAVRAALDLRERASELGLAVTVGINTGRVYFGPVGSSLHEELTVMGPTVNLAARFQSISAPGQVLVGEATHRHVHASFSLTPVSLAVKGIAEPVNAFSAERLLDHPDKVRGIQGLWAEMIGRDQELQRLHAAFDSGGTTYALVGPAGVGKSRLAAEFHRYVSDGGGVWMEGRALELTAGVGYGPFLDMFTRYLRPSPSLAALLSSLDQLVGQGSLTSDRAEAIAPFLAHLLGHSLGDQRDLRVTESSAEQRKTLTINALVDYLLAIASTAAMVLFLEDLHWADGLTIETVLRLHKAARDQPLLLLVSYRPQIDGPAAQLARLREAPQGYFEMTLHELTREQTQQLILRLLEVSGIAPSLESQVLDHAQGNPFYVEELIRSLIQKGAITKNNGRWQITAPTNTLELPESVEGVLMSRFDRLPNQIRTASRAASILDRTFSEQMFAAIAGEALIPALESMVEAGITCLEKTEPVPHYSFLHALTRQAVYENLLPSQRAELHERAGSALEKAGDFDVEQLAHHYQRSRNHPKAVEYLLKAAEHSLASFLGETALLYLDLGLDRINQLPALEQPALRARARTSRGELLERMAQHQEARGELEAALSEMQPDPLEESRIWRLLGQTHRLEGHFERAHQSYDQAEEALDRLSDRDSLVAHRAWIEVQKERAYALYFGGRGRELPAHNERVKSVVKGYGTAAQQADHLFGEMLSGFVRDRFVVSETTVATARRALHLAQTGADPGRVAEGYFVLGFSLLWGDQVEEAAEMLGQAVEETRRVGALMEECRARAYHAIALRRAGLVDEAEAGARESLELAAQLGDSYYVGHARAVLCWVGWKRGNGTCTRAGEEAYKAWGEYEDRGHAGLNTEFAWMAVWPLMAAAFERGDFDGAVEHLRFLSTPWERPLPAALQQAVDEAISVPDGEAFARSVELAKQHRFL